MEVDRNGLEVLERDGCLHLLARATPGRMGVTSGALATVLPVNFWLMISGRPIEAGQTRRHEEATP